MQDLSLKKQNFARSRRKKRKIMQNLRLKT